MPDTGSDYGALQRATNQRWHRATGLCKQAWETARDRRDTEMVRTLLARVETELKRIDQMRQDLEVIEVPGEDVTEKWDTPPGPVPPGPVPPALTA